MNKDKYFLILEYLPGDFMPIDINIITHNLFPIDYTNIRNIDVFTEKHDISEIIDMVRENNLLPEKYLHGKMSIINEKKFHYDILSKTDVYSLPDFLNNNINDKLAMNKITNLYIKYNKNSLSEFKSAIEKKDVNKIMYLLSSIDYINMRSIYLYIRNMIDTKNKSKILENAKKTA